jgi:hypothetical protein
MAGIAAQRLDRVHALDRLPARPAKARIFLGGVAIGGDRLDAVDTTCAVGPEADAGRDRQQGRAEMPAQIIERLGARQRTGVAAGNGAGHAFVRNAGRQALKAGARRKLPARQVLGIQRVDGMHRTRPSDNAMPPSQNIWRRTRPMARRQNVARRIAFVGNLLLRQASASSGRSPT